MRLSWNAIRTGAAQFARGLEIHGQARRPNRLGAICAVPTFPGCKPMAASSWWGSPTRECGSCVLRRYGCRGQCAVSRRCAGVAELCRQREPARRAAGHPRRRRDLGLSSASVAGARQSVAAVLWITGLTPVQVRPSWTEWGAVGGAETSAGGHAGRGLFALDSQRRQGL